MSYYHKAQSKGKLSSTRTQSSHRAKQVENFSFTSPATKKSHHRQKCVWHGKVLCKTSCHLTEEECPTTRTVQYELSQQPPSHFDEYCDTRKGTKSILLTKLAAYASASLITPVDVQIVDGNGSLYHIPWLSFGTYGNFEENFCLSCQGHHEKYAIFAQYLPLPGSRSIVNINGIVQKLGHKCKNLLPLPSMYNRLRFCIPLKREKHWISFWRMVCFWQLCVTVMPIAKMPWRLIQASWLVWQCIGKWYIQVSSFQQNEWSSKTQRFPPTDDAHFQTGSRPD